VEEEVMRPMGGRNKKRKVIESEDEEVVSHT
jgi:hypothetical protein